MRLPRTTWRLVPECRASEQARYGRGSECSGSLQYSGWSAKRGARAGRAIRALSGQTRRQSEVQHDVAQQVELRVVGVEPFFRRADRNRARRSTDDVEARPLLIALLREPSARSIVINTFEMPGSPSSVIDGTRGHSLSVDAPLVLAATPAQPM